MHPGDMENKTRISTEVREHWNNQRRYWLREAKRSERRGDVEAADAHRRMAIICANQTKRTQRKIDTLWGIDEPAHVRLRYKQNDE